MFQSVSNHLLKLALNPNRIESGYFRGTLEDLLIVKITTDNQPQVYQLASELRKALNQDSIGVEHDGEYHRMVKRWGGVE